MDSVLITPRLKLTFVDRAERGSQELEWLHELRSDTEATWHSINRRSETLEDTERTIQNYLPLEGDREDTGRNSKSHRMNYAVHQILKSNSSSEQPDLKFRPSDHDHNLALKSQFIGLVSVLALGPNALPIPTDIILSPAEHAKEDTLQCEIAYSFLPRGWGKGFATEAVNAVLSACQKVARSHWTPFNKIYVRAIVNNDNPKSLRVMEKTGFESKGVYEWRGEPIWIAGRWQSVCQLCIFGQNIVN